VGVSALAGALDARVESCTHAKHASPIASAQRSGRARRGRRLESVAPGRARLWVDGIFDCVRVVERSNTEVAGPRPAIGASPDRRWATAEPQSLGARNPANVKKL
jgi:hypothetical protein